MKITTESLENVNVERMKATVSQLARGDGQGAEDMAIDFAITGGCPGQRLQFKAALSSRGTAEVSHVDELHSLSEQFSGEIPSNALAAFAQLLDIDALIRMPQNQAERYIPDSLVGSVALKTGSSSIILYFQLEDEEPSGADATALKIDADKSFFLRSSMAPASVHAALYQLAAIVNILYAARKK